MPGIPDWRVADGGRWWLKDNTITEPNGDYFHNAWLSVTIGSDGVPSHFNDWSNSHTSGSKLLYSTNFKYGPNDTWSIESNRTHSGF